MDEELEEIELNEIDLEQNGDAINLPDVEDVEDVENNQNSTDATENEEQIDEEKESLKRGVNKERSLRKKAEREKKELEAKLKALEDANKTPEKTTVEELIESGVDEGIAKTIAKVIDKKKDTDSNLAKELAEVKFENSLTKKSKEEGFEDILDYADEIKDLVDKGLTLEQSYYAVTYDNLKSKNTKSEIERKVEAKMQNNKARKDILGNYNSNSGAVQNSNTKLKVTPEEKGIAAMAGMSVEEYVAVRDMQSVKDYNKYIAKKKK